MLKNGSWIIMGISATTKMIILIILVPMDDFPSEMPYFLGFQSAVAGGAPLKVLNLPGDDA